MEIFAGDFPTAEHDAGTGILHAQEYRRIRFGGAIQQPGQRTVRGQVLADAGAGLLVHAAQVEEKFLLLVPKAAGGDVDRRPAIGQLLANVFQAATAEVSLHTHVRDQIEPVASPGRHHAGQLRRTPDPAWAVACWLPYDFAGLEPAVLQTDHGPLRGFLHVAGRGRRFAAVLEDLADFLQGIEIQTHAIGQQRRLLQ